MKTLILALLLSFSASAKEPIKIVALGDSLTEGYGIEKQDAYPALLEKALKKKGHNVKVYNAGISGSTTASAPKRLKWFLKLKPQIIFLALGANDGLRGVPIESTRKNLKTTIEMAKKENIKVLLAGMMLPTNYGEKYRKSFQKLFPSLAKETGVQLMPFLLKDVATKKELNLADGIHPNEEGHKVMLKNILPEIEKLL
jgi:acyl-CoA thioesterase-1